MGLARNRRQVQARRVGRGRARGFHWRRLGPLGDQRPDRRVVHLRRGHADELALGVAQGRERAAEHAARVQVDGAVDPLGAGHRRVAVDHRGAARVVGGPVQPHRQAERVDLARGVAVEREVPHRGARPSVHRALQAGVGDHQAALVQHQVRGHLVEERRDGLAEGRRRRLELRQRLGEAVGDLHVPAAQLASEFQIVVARHAERLTIAHHLHRQRKHIHHVRAAVDEIAQEHHAAPGRGRDAPLERPGAVDGISQAAEQRVQLVEAAVHVADQIERAQLAAPVGPERHPDQLTGADLLGRLEHEHVAETLAPQGLQAPVQVAPLVSDDSRRDRRAARAVGPGDVAGVHHGRGQVEHQRDGQQVVLARQGQQRAAGLGLHVRRVDHRRQVPLQALLHDGVQHLEGVRRGVLVRVVVAHQRAAGVRRNDFGLREVAPREGALARGRGAHEQHERGAGQLKAHGGPRG